MKHFKTDTYWMITFDCIDKNGFHHEISRYFTSNRKLEKELKKILTKLKAYQNDALSYYLNHYKIGDLFEDLFAKFSNVKLKSVTHNAMDRCTLTELVDDKKKKEK